MRTDTKGFWTLISGLLSGVNHGARKLTAVAALVCGLRLLFNPKQHKEIVDEYGVASSYGYKLKKQASDFLNQLASLEEINGDLLVIDTEQIHRTVVSLFCEAKASESQIKKVIKDIYGVDLYTEQIGRIINLYCMEAIPINEELDRKCMPYIKTLGADEIFISRTPIFTAVDLASTYVMLISPQHDRTAETWELAFSILRDYGLSPTSVISDACGSLLSAITNCFGEEATQMDVFHHIKDLREEYFQVRRKLEKPMTEAKEIEERAEHHSLQTKTLQHYVELTDVVIPKNQKLIDEMNLLFVWVAEILAFPGYSLEDSIELTNWCLDCMLEVIKDFPKMRREIHRSKDRLKVTFEYLNRYFKGLKAESEAHGIEYELLERAYFLRRYDTSSKVYSDEYVHLHEAFGHNEERFAEALSIVEELCRTTKRASSLVENVNSRIRVFLNDKRGMSDNHSQLIRLYMNCRKYPKSRIMDRRGKSPVEILLHTDEHDFYELLGIGTPKTITLTAVCA